MTGSLVLDLAVGPEIWLYLTLLGCVTLFFKFSRIWSVRNLDLLLLFALSPGALMRLVGTVDRQPWIAYVWLFLGSAAWLIRCVLDLGLSRRPLLEPNLNASGAGLPVGGGPRGLLRGRDGQPARRAKGPRRTPADPSGRADPPPPEAGSNDTNSPVNRVLKITPLPAARSKPNPPQVILFAGARQPRPPRPGGGAVVHGGMEAFRPSDRGAGGRHVLPALALYPDCARGQRAGGAGGPDRGGARGLHAAARRGRADRDGRGLDARVPRADPALGRLLPRARGLAIREPSASS